MTEYTLVRIVDEDVDFEPQARAALIDALHEIEVQADTDVFYDEVEDVIVMEVRVVRG